MITVLLLPCTLNLFIRALVTDVMYTQRMWTGRILLKYALIQLSEIAVLVLLLVIVQEWIEIPAWLTWGLVGVWVAKDVILYPFVWRAYEWGSEKVVKE